MKDDIDRGRRRLLIGATALAGGVIGSAPARAAHPPLGVPAAAGMRRAWSGMRSDVTVRVVDMLHGVAAGGLRIDLSRIDGERETPLRSVAVDAHGGTGDALLAGDVYRAGTYSMLLHVGEYFRARGVQSPFLSVVPIRLQVADADARLHVAVQFGLWNLTYYRGT